MRNVFGNREKMAFNREIAILLSSIEHPTVVKEK
jgi:hypothetical protein